MSAPAILVSGVGKQFVVQSRSRQADTLAETTLNGLRRQLHRLGGFFLHKSGSGPVVPQNFWALRNISFELQQGEVLGIIGANGSGKSTLLKILSRITPPTEGEAIISGRIGSLLEIGTGFHGELTGRENTFLSGTILGMKEREISAQFDEIVAFAGVEKFIDTPVKHYSSGMYLRLAFAVAAHLRTEILLIDEVLAVGDAAFQKKCINKMSEVAHEGRTILFVSHNLGTVLRLCNRGLLLDGGNVAATGSIGDVAAEYGRIVATRDMDTATKTTGRISLSKLKVESDASSFSPSTPLSFNFRIDIQDVYWNIFIQLGITTADGQNIILDMIDSERFPALLTPGRYDIEIAMPALWLRPTIYSSRIKVIAHPEKGLTERFFSEWVEIIIEGDDRFENADNRILTPVTSWCVHAATY